VKFTRPHSASCRSKQTRLLSLNGFDYREPRTKTCRLLETRQFELAAQNKMLTDRYPKTLKTAWTVFYEHKLTQVYVHLAKLLQLAVTLPVTSASAERVQSKLKLVKTALRSTSANELRMSDLVQIHVERSISDGLGLRELVSEFALKPRKLLL
jgi:hypothetical protein